MADTQTSFTIPQLITDRTIMRGHVMRDYQDSARMWADERVTRYINERPSTEEESWARFLRFSGHWSVLNFGYWVVEEKESGAFLGEVGFADYKRSITPSLEGLPEIGWVLCPDAHGRGLATEAVAAALKWGDANLKADKSVCIFDPNHVASQRVAKKSGYMKQGMADYSGHQIIVMQRSKPSTSRPYA